eukprot:TRINITY_DN4426_c0_g1_i1.p1 TRINITY_DN4426_c0_g1~~TRINITY_DN4426_c0_g1_i1.p1  ORF type:complete len:523 (-),score=162.45 TRINITY_DN4426_c0_g1_i1:289-1857(-)
MCVRISKFRKSAAKKKKQQQEQQQQKQQPAPSPSKQQDQQTAAATSVTANTVLDRARRKFDKLDKNQDGRLQRGEIVALASWVLKNFLVDGQPLTEGQKQEETDKIMAAADANQDGELDFEEFAVWFKNTCEMIVDPQPPLHSHPHTHQQQEQEQEQSAGWFAQQPQALSPDPKQQQQPTAPLVALAPVRGSTPEMATLLAAARQRFEQLDTNGDGFLSANELLRLAEWVWASFHPAGEPLSQQRCAEEANQLMLRVDRNQDGQLDFDEFARWFIGTTTRIEAARRQSPSKAQRQQQRDLAKSRSDQAQEQQKRSKPVHDLAQLNAIKQANQDAIAQTLADMLAEEQVHASSAHMDIPSPKQEFEALEDAAVLAREAFRLFDHGQKGYLSTQELALTVRWLGVHPSEATCRHLANSLQCDQNRCTEHIFVGAMVPAPPCETLEIDGVIRAWEELDPEKTGELSEGEVMGMLTTIGEPLTPQEVQAVFQAGDFISQSSGALDYRRFTEFIMSKQTNGWTHGAV